jgi:hypothetical protein
MPVLSCSYRTKASGGKAQKIRDAVVLRPNRRMRRI